VHPQQTSDTRPAPKQRVVILNDSSVARGGATGLALLSARLLREQGRDVTFISGDGGNGGELAALGVELIALGGKLLLEEDRLRALRNGIYNTGLRDRVASYIASQDTDETVYHLHGWSRILSPAIFDALTPVATRTFIHAHDFFLACPNGSYFDFRRKQICTRQPLSAGCLATNCDKRSYPQKLWRVLRQGAVRRALDLNAGWAGILILHEGMSAGLSRAGIPKHLMTTVRNPAHPFSQHRIKAEKNSRFCFIGRTGTGKGLAALCEAAQMAGVPLRVIGDDSDQPELRNKYPQVEFTGWVDQAKIRDYLQDVRALVMPSLFSEPFGLVAAEASLSGLPVVISQTALLATEVAEHGLGFAIDPLNLSNFADVLSQVAELPEEDVHRISERGFSGATSLSQTPATWISQLNGLYRGALRSETEADQHRNQTEPSLRPQMADPHL